MANDIKAVLVQPGKAATIVACSTELRELQKIVGGYIEVAHLLEDENAIIICNEEGKLMGLSPCRTIRDEHGNRLDIICGSFLIVYAAPDDDDFSSLPEDMLKKYLRLFGQPEAFI